MHPALLSTIISASCLLALVLLFTLEKRKRARFLAPLRNFFDRVVNAVGSFLSNIGGYLGRDVIRQTVHYFFHNCLKALLSFLRRLEGGTDKLLRTNKALARKVVRERLVRTKLDEMVEHKEATALSPKEKRARKEKSIGTRL